MPLLYDLGVGAYHLGVRCMAPWNPKAAAWVKGREKLWDRLEKVAPQLQGCLWMHCASAVSYTHLRAHETVLDLVCRLLLEKTKQHTHTYT